MSAEEPTAEEVEAAIAAVTDPETRAALTAVALYAGGLTLTLGRSILRGVRGHLPNCPCVTCRGAK